MDVKSRWQVTHEIETLVEVIVKAKQDLVTAAFEKYGMNTRLASCDVFAGQKLIELFQMSELWTSCSEQPEDQDVVSYRRQKKTTELVADFNAFKLHRMEILNISDVRIVAVFHVEGHGAEQVMFANVEIVS